MKKGVLYLANLEKCPTHQSPLKMGKVEDFTVVWCGDCVEQCPILEYIARCCTKINLRFVDRDVDSELASHLSVCGGNRVPIVLFLSEDFVECARYGDRTLARYRRMAYEQLGGAAPRPLTSPQVVLAEVAEDWLREIERVHLMLRLSPRLRQRHGD